MDDGALTFGVVSHPLRALESIMRVVYRPTLEGQDSHLWGKAPPDSVHEFMAGLDGFVDNLQVTMVTEQDASACMYLDCRSWGRSRDSWN